jgi:hypothetical protein
MKPSKAASRKSNDSRVPSIGIGKPGPGTTAFIVLVFAAGILHWVLFLNYGDLKFKAHDWAKEYIYYSVLRQALESGRIPYHIPLAFHETKRFLALPETNLSPQILLLPVMDIGRFVLTNILILYAIGFAGCLLIRRRYRLSPIAFSVMFILFNFNGHLTAHIGVGHSMWTAYFMLPLFFLFILEIVEGNVSRTIPIKLGFVLFAIILQGGFHIYIWCITFLFLLLIFNWRHFNPLLSVVVYSLLLSAFRLIPAAFTLAGKKEKFIWSYPTIRDLLDALVTIRQQTPDRLRPWGTAGWWEYDTYVGVIGLAFIVYFGIILRFSKRSELDSHKYSMLDLPLLAMSVFSLSYFHAFLTRLPLPLLGSERVATRFIIIPVVFLIFLAAIRLDRYLEPVRKTLKFYVAAIVGLAVMALSFVDHSYLWSVVRLERIYKDRIVDLTAPGTITMQDDGYRLLLLMSTIISLAAVALLVYLGIRWRTTPGKST